MSSITSEEAPSTSSSDSHKSNSDEHQSQSTVSVENKDLNSSEDNESRTSEPDAVKIKLEPEPCEEQNILEADTNCDFNKINIKCENPDSYDETQPDTLSDIKHEEPEQAQSISGKRKKSKPEKSCKSKRKKVKQEIDIKSEIDKIFSLNERYLYKCKKCDLRTNSKSHLRRHELVHKSIEEVTTYQCNQCNFKTKYLHSIKDHYITHTPVANIHQCSKCSFTTKYPRNLRRHEMVHQDNKSAKIYSCNHCAFKTKHLTSIRSHQKIHKTNKKGTKSQYSVLTNEENTESNTSTEKTESPSTSEQNKEELEDVKEELDWTEMIVNEESQYFITKKNSVESDGNSETDNMEEIEGNPEFDLVSGEQRIYACKRCLYHSTCPSKLRRHQLVHKNIEEVQSYQCNQCDFITKYTHSIKNHYLMHMNKDGNIHQCKKCNFRTKYPGKLSRHELIHLDIKEAARILQAKKLAEKKKEDSAETTKKIKIYQCDECEFKLKNPKVMVKHLLSHTSTDEADMYRCNKCNFGSKYKNNLKRHLKKHLIVFQEVDEEDSSVAVA